MTILMGMNWGLFFHQGDKRIAIARANKNLARATEAQDHSFTAGGTVNEVAKHDGFMDYEDMLVWFRHHYVLTFTGIVLRWHPKALSIGGL